MMLEGDKYYRDQEGCGVRIMGRIRYYSEFTPFVFSAGGNWYDEATGRFVLSTKRYCGFRLPVKHTSRCIANHQPVEVEVAL